MSVAPEELPYFDDLVSLSTQTMSSETRDRDLAFNAPSAEFCTTSAAIYFMAKPLINFLWLNGKKSAQEITSQAAKSAKTVFIAKIVEWEKRHEGPPPVLLDAATFSKLEETVHRHADDLNLSKKKAVLLVDILKSQFLDAEGGHADKKI